MVVSADPTECFFSVAIDCEVKDVKGHLKNMKILVSDCLANTNLQTKIWTLNISYF